MTDAATPTGPVTRGSMARVGTATVVTALCGYAVIYLAARDLAPAGFSVFGVFWGAFGLVTGAANGLLQETTREVRSARLRATGPCRTGPRTHPMRVAALVGVVAAVVIAGSSPLWCGAGVRRVAAAVGGAAVASGWPGSACTPPCWACWPAPTGGRSTAR